VVYLDNRVKDGVFHDEQLEMLTAFANQAAVAIQNARLYDNLKKSVEDRLRLQSELLEKETQRLALEEANRLKSDYIGFVTHELRNPLTTIRGFIQTLETDETLERSEQLEFYETIEAECDRMLEMINELLDSSRLEAGRPITLNARMIDLTPLLERICRFQRFYRFWTPAHNLKLEIEPGLPAIEADEDKLHQILSNLLSNAIKYSPDGGDILVKAYTVENGVNIEVRDHGIGMTQEQVSRLFTPYERNEREEIRTIPGTGLGLFLTRHLVDLHGGTISCQSEAGRGSLFSLYLPRYSASE
jgi:signal transduction histidine kinase